MSNYNVEKVFKEAANQLLREKKEFVTYLEKGKKAVKKRFQKKNDSSTSKGYWCCSGRSGPESMTLQQLEEDEDDEAR